MIALAKLSHLHRNESIPAPKSCLRTQITSYLFCSYTFFSFSEMKHLTLYLIFAILIPVACLASGNPLVLQPEALPFTPTEFYVAEVVDARSSKQTVATLVPTGTADLAGGAQVAVTKFIAGSLKQNRLLRPVVLRLEELQVREKAGNNSRVAGEAVVQVVFELRLNEDETLPLTQYRGGLRYDRPASQEGLAAPALQKALAQALTYFNNWINTEAATNPMLAKSIRVTFSDHSLSETKDTVFYHSRRPLTWSDFKGQPSKPTKFAASVYPSFAYEGRPEMKEGVLHLHLNLKVFMVQSASWVKAPYRDNYTLNHEQRHFDIARLVAKRFREKITPDILTVADYNSILQYHYI